jgi:ribosome-associated protein
MAELLVTELKTHGELPGIEGTPQCEWVLVDVGDVVVHLFKPEVREFYNLEKMWDHITDEDESSEHNVA